jgi:putative hydrolase of the HAD superfamily
VRTVAFDAMGVLYRSADDVADLLVPFGRARGSRLSDEEIRTVYRRACVGEMTSAVLWEQLGVAGAPHDLDAAYTAGHEMTPGMLALIDELRALGVPLGCISNDVTEWSRALRVRHGLDARIPHWTVSGDVRARKPDERIYRAFLERTGSAASDVIFVDDRPANVAAAAGLGFVTVLVDFAGIVADPTAVRSIEGLRSALAAQVAARLGH